MKLLQSSVLNGPNYWSVKRKKLVQFTLDLEELEQKPTNLIPGFYQRLKQMLPSLYEHACSRNKPGGFFERVAEGTWMGHVIEHIALELQSLAGIDVGFGRTRGTGKPGVYHVVYEYDEAKAGLYAGEAAIKLVEAIISASDFKAAETVTEIKRLWLQQRPGPSTQAIIEEAQKRHIPVMRLDDDCLVQLGWGHKQKRMAATLSQHSSALAVDLACDKMATKEMLSRAYLPTPRGMLVTSPSELEAALQTIGFPVVIKPFDGNHGRCVYVDIRDVDQAAEAFACAQRVSHKVVVEQYIHGKDFRVLLVNHKMVAAAHRSPASVTGDGLHTIAELVAAANADPRRGDDHENILTRIPLDEPTFKHLAKSGFTPDTVLPPGKICELRPTANLSTGGTATDVTDCVHPENIALFERAARVIGLDICGIDVMAPSLSEPILENGGRIIEVNAAPGLRMHLQPSGGRRRNVAAPIIDMLFPGGDGRIPIVAVTGTNGKTTTTRMVAAMAMAAGHQCGYTTTDGVYLNGDMLLKGDCSGPRSAQLILQDPLVSFAALETARGGMLRAGLGFDACSCAVLTNISSDHLGLDGIDTLEKLAKVKSLVAEAVAEDGYAVLNADDDRVYAIREQLNCHIALFSLHADSARIEAHCSRGGVAAVLDQECILIRKGNHFIPIEEVKNIPSTFDGRAPFNIANALAASLAAYVSGLSLRAIQSGLASFEMNATLAPGRLNLYQVGGKQVLIDYAHNPEGIRALGEFVHSFKNCKKYGIIAGIGDRRDEDIIAVGQAAARIFDEIIIRHDEDLRGRSISEIDHLVRRGIQNIDPGKPVSSGADECQALTSCLQRASAGDLIVVLVENIDAISNQLAYLTQKENTAALKKAG